MTNLPDHSSGRILALDVGGRRIGIALSDPDRTIASGQPTIDARPPHQAYAAIKKLVQKYDVTQVVIGLPLTLRGEVGPQAELIQTFAAELTKQLDVPIVLHDERLTSVAADRSLEAMGVRRNKRREHVDQLAAVLILQGYLDLLRMPPLPPLVDDEWDDDEWDDDEWDDEA